MIPLGREAVQGPAELLLLESKKYFSSVASLLIFKTLTLKTWIILIVLAYWASLIEKKNNQPPKILNKSNCAARYLSLWCYSLFPNFSGKNDMCLYIQTYIFRRSRWGGVWNELYQHRGLFQGWLCCAEGDAVAGEGLGGQWGWFQMSPGRSCCPHLNEYLAGIIKPWLFFLITNLTLVSKGYTQKTGANPCWCFELDCTAAADWEQRAVTAVAFPLHSAWI